MPVIIQKIDFFRYIAVYHYGGFYFDVDIESLEPLDDNLLFFDANFPLDEIMNDEDCEKDRYHSYCEKSFNNLLGQYAFGAKKNNDFIKVLIDNIHNNIDNIIEKYNNLEDKKDLQFVYDSTGPDYVTYNYLEYKNRQSIKILQYDKSQYFGKYAIHKWLGTWK